MNDYFYEKSKMYYEKYKAGKLTKKVGAIIKDGNKYLTIIREGKRAMFAGSSASEGETTKQDIIREVFGEFIKFNINSSLTKPAILRALVLS